MNPHLARIAGAATASLYPFESHWMELDDGVRMHYVDEGAGDPVLMVHGNPTWSFYYRDLIGGLRDRCRVIAPDHVGCGLSDKPGKYPYILARHIANLERLVLALDLRDITLVVHDWGGPIGLGVAARHPDRFRRLVITNTAGFRAKLMPLAIALCRVPLLGDLLVRGCNVFAGLITRVGIAHQDRVSPAVRQGYTAPYASWADRVAILRFIQDIPMLPRDRSWGTLVELENGLGRLADKPTMLIWGMQDWVFTPAFIGGFLQYFPHAQVHRVRDAGHLVLEDAHERALPWIEAFMAETAVL